MDDGCGSGCMCGCGGNADKTGTVMGVFAGFAGSGARVGFEYNMGTDLDLDDYGINSSLMSFYGSYDLSSVLEGLTAMVKYDMLDTDTKVETDETTTNLMVGVSKKCSNGLTVSPNMLQTTVGENEATTAVNVSFLIEF